ncbi:MAG TPA: hypothetical protein VIC54_11345 [Terriglobales bacterium]
MKLYLELDRAPRTRPLPPALVDRCAWWLPWLHRRRRAPWTTLRSALLARLLERAVPPATLGDRSAPLWGALHVINFHRGPSDGGSLEMPRAQRGNERQCRSCAATLRERPSEILRATWRVQCW